MKVFVFDLVSYDDHLDFLKVDGSLPWPLPKRHFQPSVAVKTYREHFEAWELLEQLGYDGVAFNEHHTSPYGLMNSPNLIAAVAAQRTQRLRLLIYGNLLPLHQPLRLAEELAMLDCLSDGRIICGLARGIPREYRVYQVPPSESRARFEEAWEIIRGLWTDEVFSFNGQFWNYHDIALWPRPVQQPYPLTWMPVTSSAESIEWAAQHNIPITPGLGRFPRIVTEDICRYYAQQLVHSGHTFTPDHLILQEDVYIADNKERAVTENGPYALYYYQTLLTHGNTIDDTEKTHLQYRAERSHDYMRPESRALVANVRERWGAMTLADLRQRALDLPWGPADAVQDHLIRMADRFGGSNLLISFNRGAMPQDQFLRQIEWFGRAVLPALHAHEVVTPAWGL